MGCGCGKRKSKSYVTMSTEEAQGVVDQTEAAPANNGAPPDSVTSVGSA